MYTLSVLGLSICLVYISIIMQGTEADKCSDCSTAATKAVLDAGGDKDKICSAGRTFIDCMEDNCDVASFKTALDAAKKAHTQLGCGAETKTCVACTSDYAGAGGQCSAAEIFVECAKDCTPSGAISAVETVAEAAMTAACRTEADKCRDCSRAAAKAVLDAGGDKDKICSAGRTNLDCMEENCDVDSIKTTLDLAKKAFTQLGCGAEADTCSECKKTYEDKGKTCSAANVYVACAEKDCTSFTQIFKVVSAKAAQLTCGAGSILVNLTVIVLGLTLYTIF